jgi:SAM-dependent methyltransferase
VVSDSLLRLVRCPECRGHLRTVARDLVCEGCSRRYRRSEQGYLDLRPERAFSETTRYIEPELHADARHETVSVPLLSAAIRNDMLRKFLAPTAADRVVDLGCGSGRALVWNQDLGASQVGIDVSPYFAREALSSVDLIVGDLRRLPVADGSFTKAFSLDVAEHLSRDSLIEMLKEAARVLVPGGALFIYTHVRKNSRLAVGVRAVNRVAFELDRFGWIDLRQERLRKSDHVNPLADIDDFERVADHAGFQLERIRYYTPLAGAVIENVVMRLGEGVLARRAARRSSSSLPDSAQSLRAARIEAKRRIERGGPTYATLRALTWFMKLDVLLFGRIRSGPFFGLLIKK